jgi:hypothetical protein
MIDTICLGLSIFVKNPAMKNKKISFLILLICYAFSPVSGQKKLEVLFLGNSYTYVNDLPNLITQIALSKGDTLLTDENDVGGYTLQAHSTDATSLSKINSRPWDYVILQEQSQRPAFPQSQVAVEVYPFADSLNKYIKNNDSCTQTVFFMTWGRKNGDATNCASYPPICTYEGMQTGLRYSYLLMGQTLNAVVSPVGIVWKRVRNEGDSIELYSADESHPSLAGSYLAACTFYATLFQKSPIGASYIPAGLNAATAIHLQQYAHQVVFDSLSVWNIDTTKVKANFSTNLNQNILTINNSSQNATSYFWDFGDGHSQSGNVINHSYSSVGDYTIKLIAFKGCTTDTRTEIVHVSVVGINKIDPHSAKLKLFPVPAGYNLYFEMDATIKTFDFSIFNSFGCMVLNGKIENEHKIDLSSLRNGMYYIRMSADQYVYSGKFQVLK